MLEKYLDENLATISTLVAAANGTIATMAVLDNIKTGVSIAGGLMSLVIGIFTIRYLIIKTKTIKNHKS